jgi:hypothetical protein
MAKILCFTARMWPGQSKQGGTAGDLTILVPVSVLGQQFLVAERHSDEDFFIGAL